MKQPPEIKNIYRAEEGYRKLAERLSQYSKVAILVDEHTGELCLPRLRDKLSGLVDAQVVWIPAGEGSKSLLRLKWVLRQLWQEELDRQALLINLGGGVVSDLGGFVAGIYKRGIDFINIPTSLLAMADASSGGKTGINFQGAKNQLGLFLEPQMVLIDTAYLETLPPEHLRAGKAEMIKHGLIADAAHYRELVAAGLSVLPSEATIMRSIAIKANIVAEDPREEGRRKLLNFGHTLGHALESLAAAQKVSLSHGEAVGLGMLGELTLSILHCDFPENRAKVILVELRARYSAAKLTYDEKALTKFLISDKKNQRGELRFSLLKDIGSAEYDVALPLTQALSVLKDLWRG